MGFRYNFGYYYMRSAHERAGALLTTAGPLARGRRILWHTYGMPLPQLQQAVQAVHRGRGRV